MLPTQPNPFYPYCSQDIQEACSGYKITTLPFEQNHQTFSFAFFDDHAHGYLRPAIQDGAGIQSLRHHPDYFLKECLDYLLKVRANAEAQRRIAIPIIFEYGPQPRQWGLLAIQCLHLEKHKFDLKKLELLKQLSVLEKERHLDAEILLKDRLIKKYLKELYPQTRAIFYDSWPHARLSDLSRQQRYIKALQIIFPELTEIAIEQPFIQPSTELDSGVCVVRSAVTFIKHGSVKTPAKIRNQELDAAGYILYRRGKDYQQANALFKQRQHLSLEITQTQPIMTRGFVDSPSKQIHLLDAHNLNLLQEKGWVMNQIVDGYTIQRNPDSPSLLMNNNRLTLYRLQNESASSIAAAITTVCEQMAEIVKTVGALEVSVHCTLAEQQTLLETACRKQELKVITETAKTSALRRKMSNPPIAGREEFANQISLKLIWAYEQMMNNQPNPYYADILNDMRLLDENQKLRETVNRFFLYVWANAEIEDHMQRLKAHLEILELEQLLQPNQLIDTLPLKELKQLLSNLNQHRSALQQRWGEQFDANQQQLQEQIQRVIENLEPEQTSST